MPQTTEQERFTLDELCVLADIPRRTVRYYIQRGLVERPIGETRAAYYTREHLGQLLQIRKWSEAGVSLDRIGEILEGDDDLPPAPRRKPGDVSVWSRVHLGEGLELSIEPDLAGLSPEQVRELVRQVTGLVARMKAPDKPRR